MKKFLSKFDLFPATPILRADGETEVVNLCGSLFSICIFSVFTFIFISKIISTVQLQNISATEIIQTKSSTDERIGNITIGIGLQQKNLVALQNIFQVRAFILNQFFQETEIEVFPCHRKMWDKLDDTKYQTLKISTHMCIQRDNVSIYGQNGAKQLNVLYFNLSKCSNATSPVPCESPANITSYFASQLNFGRFFACSLLVLDTGLNPTKENPYAYSTYQKTHWLLFNSNQQILGQLFLGTYEVTTDTNFLPFVDTNTQNGYFVSEATVTTLVNAFNLPVYVEFYIFASPLTKKIERTYGKFDEILSYVGGLYGIVISLFAFFIMSFNQYKYELRVSEGAFSFEDGHMARESDLHFGKYLKYVAYDWMKTFFCYEIDWKDCKAIDEARSEAIQQIEVKHLLKRISHLEKIISLVVKQQEETAVLMTQSNSISEVKRRRIITEYCEKFTDVDKSMTIANFDQINALLSLGLMASINGDLGNKVIPGDNIDNSLYQLRKNQIVAVEKYHRDSLHIMEQYLEKYSSRFQLTEESLNLTEENLEAEDQLTEAFYELEEQTRLKLIKKIPLGILYRIHLRKTKKEVPNNYQTTLITQQSLEKPSKDKTVKNKKLVNHQSLPMLGEVKK